MLAPGGHRMEKGKRGYGSIDEYVASFPEEVQAKLKQLRQLIRQITPEAQERISYQMPAFYLNGNLVYFAAHAKHIGFYPTASGIARFKKELAGFHSSKGAVQFPLDEPLPLELIRKIVRFRVAENEKKKRRR